MNFFEVFFELVKQKISSEQEMNFVIFGDRSAKYEQVAGVLEMLKKSGVKNISLATELKN